MTTNTQTTFEEFKTDEYAAVNDHFNQTQFEGLNEYRKELLEI